jgi:hypothetical protein
MKVQTYIELSVVHLEPVEEPDQALNYPVWYEWYKKYSPDYVYWPRRRGRLTGFLGDDEKVVKFDGTRRCFVFSDPHSSLLQDASLSLEHLAYTTFTRGLIYYGRTCIGASLPPFSAAFKP